MEDSGGFCPPRRAAVDEVGVTGAHLGKRGGEDPFFRQRARQPERHGVRQLDLEKHGVRLKKRRALAACAKPQILFPPADPRIEGEAHLRILPPGVG